MFENEPNSTSRLTSEFLMLSRDRAAVDMAYTVLDAYAIHADDLCRRLTDEVEAKVVELNRLDSEVERRRQELADL